VLGTAVAIAALAQGLKVAVIDHSADCPHAPPGAFVVAGVDLTDPDAAIAALEKAKTQLGGLDALLNIAGGFRWETVQDGSPESWTSLYRLNVQTALNASRAAIPYLKESPAGRIVNVGAAGALKVALGMGAYAASKGGVHALTQALAEELKGENITVNAVLPSIIDTPQNRADMPKADPSKWVAPADLAAVILFLASEEARAVTGALVPVTGRV
jgi:NAD(P)-dependent dehydrogenase (short-subunit alcohol dehydrogenase family)